MQKTVTYLMAMLMAFGTAAGFSACGDDDEPEQPTPVTPKPDPNPDPTPGNDDNNVLSLSVRNIDYHQSGLRRTAEMEGVLVTTDVDYDNLAVESDADWCHPYLNNGYQQITVTFGVDRNESPQQRVATISIIIKSTGQRASFTVTQAADDGTGYVIVGYFNSCDTIFSHEMGLASFVTTNRPDWTVESDADWLQARKLGETGLEIHADDYIDQNQPRRATATFYDGSTPIGSYTVLQNVDDGIYIIDNRLYAGEGTVIPQYQFFDVSPAGGTYDLPIMTRSCNWYYRYDTPDTYKQLQDLGHSVNNSWFTVEKLNDAMLRLRVKPRAAGNTARRYGAFTVLPAFSSYYLIMGMERDYMLPCIIVTDSETPQLGGEGYGYSDHSSFD
ncbi:MAG: BACON domain-containing protein [Prevotella sp.]|nr:BACON domain-containing protein [Prevotella sp.]